MPKNQWNKPQLADVFKKISPWVWVLLKTQLVAFKVIGDKRLPQGYLLIVSFLTWKQNTRTSYVSYVFSIFPLNRLIVFYWLADFNISFKSLVSHPLSRLSTFAMKFSHTHNLGLNLTFKVNNEIAH